MTQKIEQVQLLAKSKKPAYLRECELATRWAASVKLLQKPIEQLLQYEELAVRSSTSELPGDRLHF